MGQRERAGNRVAPTSDVEAIPLHCASTRNYGINPGRCDDRSADVPEDAVKRDGERVRVAVLVEPPVVAREGHRFGPESLGDGQRGAVGEGALGLGAACDDDPRGGLAAGSRSRARSG
jgi:hypothetical protein